MANDVSLCVQCILRRGGAAHVDDIIAAVSDHYTALGSCFAFLCAGLLLRN
jgi:hypothetical protein